ncbi:LysE family transporter [Aquitalea sp.]|uniref:LysE/ArgO family amino acid transporter n=1 Tax=Aquitalea sp. TaxID=1872623 RepID=UPI00258CE2A4|nr:LysE family transporter [Aquitalea sp.]
MTLFTLYGQALIVGLAIAAPVGPIGLLCIDRTLRHGPWAGLATGLGAATADGLYASLGALGLTVLIRQLTALAVPLALAGGGFLLWQGLAMLRAPQGEPAMASARPASGLAAAYGSALGLTLGNPMTILSFVAIFSGLTGQTVSSGNEAMVMVAGIVSGSALWWCVLAFGIGQLLRRAGAGARRLLDRGCGLLLLGMGGWMWWQALRG